jgi:nudix-type nucleoside diphosphatase (YffH/AdpP family)
MTSEVEDESIVSFKLVHQGFSKFGVAQVKLPDGAVVAREIEDHGTAAAVLPYDPSRGIAVMVRQFRPAVLYAGGEAHMFEVPAGLIDKGEAPEDAARREAFEEVGLKLEQLESVGTCFAMPGISTERTHLFLAEITAGSEVHVGGGLATEHETLEVVHVPLDELALMADRDELTDLKTLALVQTLRLRHPDVFQWMGLAAMPSRALG